jgi:hypothetical protein
MNLRAEDVAKEHVRRVQLPWREQEAGLTECGLEAAKFQSLDYRELLDKVRSQGQARAALSTCMTCWQTAERYQGSWNQQSRDFRAPSLVQVLHRELERHLWGRAPKPDPQAKRIGHEIAALAQLAELHRGEFEEIIRQLEQAIDFKDLQQRRRQASQR